MPNAKDALISITHRILLVGDTGNGKTTQFLTLSGKKYMHIFDPNAILSLKGYDVDYDEYLPTPIRAAVSSLSKGKGDPAASSSDVYKNFESTFNERLISGFFDQYDWIGFDSATTLLDLIMDRVLTINGRLGTWPHEDDWGPQMIAFTNICRTLTAMKKNIFVTGHMHDKQNRKAGTSRRQPMMTGQLVQKIPLLFTDILGCDVDIDAQGKALYTIRTVPNHEFTVIRCSIKGLEPVENVNIDFKQPVEGQGLGGIINWERKQLQGT